MKSGLNIALFVGIDFTASNGTVTSPKSLHFINLTHTDTFNPYQQVIQSVGEILIHYDTDKMVPVYGFGAKPRFPEWSEQTASHCFPCTGRRGLREDEVFQVEGVLQLYSYVLANIELDGPTYFAKLIRRVIERTRIDLSSNPDHYCFLLIITDGVIHDFQPTVEELVEASKLPISIVIVGVGNEGNQWSFQILPA